MIVTHTETLQFYDCDVLFAAKDRQGRKYIAVHDGEYETGSEYKIAPVEEEALIEFKAGRIDLRSLMMTAPNGEWYKTRIGVETETIELEKQVSPLVITEDMPESGYYLLRFDIEKEDHSSRPVTTERPNQDSKINIMDAGSGGRSRATFMTNPVLLKDLLDDMDNGKIQLPDFQRSWVWDDERIKDLLVSISNMFPIGAILGLTAGGNVAFKTRPIEGAEIRSNDKPDMFLLDGQQRLTSLYQALRHPGPVNTRDSLNQPIKLRYYMNIMAGIDPNIGRGDLLVSMPDNLLAASVTDHELEVQDLCTSHFEYQNHLIPTETLMDPLKWATGYIQYWERSNEPHPFGNPFRCFKRFEESIIGNFNEYQLPLIALDQDTSMEAVCTVFEKMNTSGVALNVFELKAASFACDTETFSLKDDWEDRKERMYSFAGTLQGIQGDHFLQTISLLKSFEDRKQAIAAGIPEIRAPSVSRKRRDVLNLTVADYRNWSDRTEQGFIRAAEYLQTQYVFKQKDVPYTAQIIPLAALHVELEEELNSAIAKSRLERWYWSGVFGEQYASNAETRAEQDMQEVTRYVREGIIPNTVLEATFAPQRIINLRSRSSAAYKGLYALLMKNGASDWMSGSPLGIVHCLDKNIDIHHIFPIPWCKDSRIPSRLYNSIINRTLVDASTNRIIGGNAPSSYLPRLRAQSVANNLEDILYTHLLDTRILEEDDFPTFFMCRGKAMLEMVGRAMGKNLGDSDEALRDALIAGGMQSDNRLQELSVEGKEPRQYYEEQEYDEFGVLAYEMAGSE